MVAYSDFFSILRIKLDSVEIYEDIWSLRVDVRYMSDAEFKYKKAISLHSLLLLLFEINLTIFL